MQMNCTCIGNISDAPAKDDSDLEVEEAAVGPAAEQEAPQATSTEDLAHEVTEAVVESLVDSESHSMVKTNIVI